MEKVKNKPKYTLFTARALAILIIPIVIESALSMSLGMIDGIMASHAKAGAGDDIVAAITQVDQISNLLIQLFVAFGAGGAILTSQLLGAGKVDEANKSAKQLFVIMTLISVVVMVVCMTLNRQILGLLFGDQPQATMNYASDYFLIMAASYPFLAVFNCCAALLRAQRKSMNTMISGVISFFLNVAFNAIFIYWAKLEVIGVALGTLLARIFPAGFTLFLLAKKGNLVSIKIFEKFRFNGGHLKKIMRLAVPSGIENSLFQLGKILVIVFISIASYNVATGIIDPETGLEVLKNYEASANSAAYNVNTMSSIVGNGINTSILTVIGQAIGKGDIGQVKYYIKKMIILSYIGNALCVALVWALAVPILNFYDVSDQARDIAWQCLCVCLAFQFFTYPLSFGLPAVLKASSDVRYVMVAAIVSMIIFRVGLCYLLTCDWFYESTGRTFGHMGAMGLWIGMIADWCVRSLLFGVRLLTGRWKKSSGMLKPEGAVADGVAETQTENVAAETEKVQTPADMPDLTQVSAQIDGENKEE